MLVVILLNNCGVSIFYVTAGCCSAKNLQPGPTYRLLNSS